MLCTNSRSLETFAHELQGRAFCTENPTGPGILHTNPSQEILLTDLMGPEILRTNSKDHEIVYTNFKNHEILRTTSMGSKLCPRTPRPLHSMRHEFLCKHHAPDIVRELEAPSVRAISKSPELYAQTPGAKQFCSQT